MNSSSSALDTSAAQYAVSDSGELLYARGGIFPDRRNALVWIDRDGNEERIGTRLDAYFAPRLSPDGGRIAYFTLGMEKQIWLYDLDRDVSTPLITNGYCAWPMWLPAGNDLIVSWADTAAHTNIYLQPIGGSTAMRRLTEDPSGKFGSSVTPDGRQIAFVEGGSSYDIRICDLVTGAVRPFAVAAYDEVYPEFSPDGRWMAYCANPEGHYEVYVRPANGNGETIKISAEGGREPVWARSGGVLFYRSLDYDRMMAVDVRAGVHFTAGKPRLLFERKGLGGGHPVRGYDLSLDDRRFLMLRLEERKPQPITEMTLVQNWFQDIKRLVPGR